MRDARFTQLYSVGQTLAFNCTGVLTFLDSEAATELLSALDSHDSIEYACLVDAEGHEFATYGRDPIATDEDTHNADEFLVVNVPVHDNDFPDELLGVLTLTSNSNDLNSHFWNYMTIVAGTVLLALVFALIPLTILYREISQPILLLAETARAISDRNDYSIRLKRDSADEIGVMYSAFNGLLDQVQHSEAQIRNAQLEIISARQRAENANRAKSEFLANMSHEIRTPLTGILGFTEVLLTDPDVNADARAEYLSTIHKSGTHLLSLINDILDLSKIEAGRLSLECLSCNPHLVISEVVSVMRVKAIEKNISFDYRWTTDVPATITSDPGRLRQMVLNLVSNAIKFTSAGGVRILVSIRQELSSPNARLLVEVVDTGVGIADDMLQSIFEPFVQADNSVTRNYGGTGLGLAIARKLSRMLGGDLTVTSCTGKGTAFRLDIDAGNLEGIQMSGAEAADAFLKKKSEMHSASDKAAVAGLNTAKILVVEDGEVNRRFLSVVLKRLGVTVQTAENGKIGVDLAMANQFDLVLMDMQMPVMDGYTAARTLRKHGSSIPIIALTAHAMVGDREKCIDAGCTGYLSKPIDTNALLQTLADCLQTSPQSAPAIINDAFSGVQTAVHSSLPCDDDREMQEIVEVFYDGLIHNLDLMQRALDTEDDVELAKLAHWLKGAGGTAGFGDFTAPASQLEQASRSGNTAQYEDHLSSLKEIAGRIALSWRS